MEVEYPHNQVRRVRKLEVGTPLIAPSFSSWGFPHISDIWEEFRHRLYGVCLVSAFDVASGFIPSDVANMVNVIILDSGLYETDKGWTKSGYRDTLPSTANWTRFRYHETTKCIGEGGNAILVNFDHVGELEDQIERASEDFCLAPHAASDFLVKPTNPSEWVNIPKLSQHLEALRQFDVIGITARESGGSFLKRCGSIVMLRDLLNDAGLDTPIHVFGAIKPYEVLTYFFCGADIFDGLNWLRLSFQGESSVPIDESALKDLKWNLPDSDLLAEEWTNNLRSLYRIQEALRDYAANGSFEALEVEFPLARRAAHIADIAGAEVRI